MIKVNTVYKLDSLFHEALINPTTKKVLFSVYITGFRSEDELDDIVVSFGSEGSMRKPYEFNYLEMSSNSLNKSEIQFTIPLDKLNEDPPYLIRFFSENGITSIQDWKIRISWNEM